MPTITFCVAWRGCIDGREGNEEALAQFYQAIKIDANYAAAHGMAARTYVQRNSGCWMTDRAGEVMEAERLARRAITFGHDDAVALCTAGFALADICGEIADGDALIDRSIEINQSRCGVGLALQRLGQGFARRA